MKVKFTIPGEPKGKARPRVLKSGWTYTPQETEGYENLIKVFYRSECGQTFFEHKIPVNVMIIAFYGIPESESKKKQQKMRSGEIRPIKKPDADNLAKVVLDSLNKVAYHDDTQVVDLSVKRFYADNPRVVVIIEEAEPVEDMTWYSEL